MRPATPRSVRSRAELVEALAEVRAAERTIALVPTMGALHEGHRALLRHAREVAGAVVVSIFVNPLQFAAGEDLDRYPRSLSADLSMCADEGVDVVWAPPTSEMYLSPPQVRVCAGRGAAILEGAVRPGHLDGVLTVVCKLFSTIRPDVAVFGQKDGQQLALVRRMVADLDLGVRVDAVATVRDDDGLALSSRNAYLDAAQREEGLALSRALHAAAEHAAEGPQAARTAAREHLPAADYVALVDPDTLEDWPDDAVGGALLLVAAHVGPTRLIDNALLQLGPYQ